MATREEALRSLKVDDIFHGYGGNDAIVNCIVTRIDENWVEARRIPTQQDHIFSRATGVSVCGHYTIDCVEPLPLHIQKIWRALDLRYRAKDNPALSEAELEAFDFTFAFQAAHTI